MFRSIIYFISIISLGAVLVSADEEVGCYSGLPSGAVSKGTYIYQSSAYCSGECSGYSYFALFDSDTCYCFNSAPSDDKETDSCNSACSGYGQETCGGTSSYTVYSTGDDDDDGDEDSSAASDSTSVTGTTAATNSDTTSTTATTSSTSNTPTTTTSSSSSSSSSSDVATTDSADSVADDDAVTSLVTQSTNGVTSVVTVTTTPTASSSSNDDKDSKSSSSGSNKGAIIGGAVGGVVGGIILLAAILFAVWYFRRRNSNDDDSVNTFVDDAIYDEAIKRQPAANPFESPQDFNMNVDQRLNPIELGNRRLSEGSLADHADYSRKILRVANPDDNV